MPSLYILVVVIVALFIVLSSSLCCCSILLSPLTRAILTSCRSCLVDRSS